MNNPIISVIVPVYNVETYLKKCIDSILNQTFKDFELIIVNDGSTDNSLNIINEYNDVRIKVINKENGGLTSARLAGFKIAKGEFVCFPDSDDYIELNYLEKLYNSFNDNIDIVISSYFVEENNQEKILFKDEIIEKEDFSNKLILPNIYCINEKEIPNYVWLRMYRKSVINKQCFISERKVYTEDLFFNFYALLNAKNIKIIDIPLYHYIVHQNSLTLKYRPNKSQMLENRYNLILKYCKDNNISIEDYRLLGLEKNKILSILFNAKLSKNKDIFIEDCKKINLYKNIFKLRLDKKEKLLLILLYLKLYNLLYLIYCKAN